MKRITSLYHSDDELVTDIMCQQCQKKQGCCEKIRNYISRNVNVQKGGLPSDEKLAKDRFDQTESFVIERDISNLKDNKMYLWMFLLALLGLFSKYTPFV